MSSRGMPVTEAVRERRRNAALKRQAEYDKLSLQEKLQRLPPEPHCAKQRNKLLLLVEAQTKQKPVQSEQVESKVKKSKKDV